MKRTLLAIAAVTAFSATEMQAQTASGKKVLVAYYSYGGNTREVARQIAEATGGDLFEIVPVEAYPAQHDAVVEQAKREINQNYRPALKGQLPDIGAYDVVFVGSPCWWATVAPPVATFLSQGDWTGKRIAPFMTHEGSRMGRTEADVRKLCPGATVLQGLPVRGGAVKTSQDAVAKWLAEMKLTN